MRVAADCQYFLRAPRLGEVSECEGVAYLAKILLRDVAVRDQLRNIRRSAESSRCRNSPTSCEAAVVIKPKASLCERMNVFDSPRQRNPSGCKKVAGGRSEAKTTGTGWLRSHPGGVPDSFYEKSLSFNRRFTWQEGYAAFTVSPTAIESVRKHSHAGRASS